jgi:hypothetical protein
VQGGFLALELYGLARRQRAGLRALADAPLLVRSRCRIVRGFRRA